MSWTRFPRTRSHPPLRHQGPDGHDPFHLWEREISRCQYMPHSFLSLPVRRTTDVGPLLRVDTCSPADRKSTRLNSSHSQISYAVFCLKKKKKPQTKVC